MTVEIITASQAFKLAMPTDQEGLDRYKQMIADVITESAMGMLKSVTVLVPESFVLEIVSWLQDNGYSTSIQPDDMQYWSVIMIDWSNANV